MSDIQTFTSFTTSNCYVVTPEKNSDICYIIDLPPDVEPALEYVKNNNLSIGGCLLTHLSLIHISSPRDKRQSRMPSSA